MVDLAVNTRPTDQATFTLMYANARAEVVQRIATNTVMKGVFRGKYLYEIKKSNFKEVKGSLNLVDWSWTAEGLVCQLVTISSDDEVLPCNKR